ncbi:MAG: c-type cytochrome [Proteobacteria bacterium]|nr:c-type cytochrome [Pseudomonadota bacterium]MCL2307270.1 c-type cytochrome [Pseudomonadota bacterium]
MKLKVMMLVAAGALLSMGAASAQDAAALVKSKNCTNCHDIEAKKMGPSYKELTAKYAGNKDAVPTIVKKLKDGQGHMKATATDDEIKAMVEFALSQK